MLSIGGSTQFIFGNFNLCCGFGGGHLTTTGTWASGQWPPHRAANIIFHMFFELIFFLILIALLCWDSPWQQFDLNVRPVSRPVVKIGFFVICLLAFSMIWGNPTKDTSINRAFYRFTTGIFILIFAKGPKVGNLEPISTRPIMILVGVVLVIFSIFPILGQW